MTAKNAKPTQQRLIDAAEAISQPIDYDSLVDAGVIKKVGGWYKILRVRDLPEHALFRIKAMKGGNHVKFRKPSKRLAKFLRAREEDLANGSEAESDAERDVRGRHLLEILETELIRKSSRPGARHRAYAPRPLYVQRGYTWLCVSAITLEWIPRASVQFTKNSRRIHITEEVRKRIT